MRVETQQLVISLCSAALLAPLTGGPGAVALLYGGFLVQTIVQIALRTLATVDQRLAKACAWASAFVWSVCSGNHLITACHELGHTIMAKAMFPKMSPKIEIVPFSHGMTRFKYHPARSFLANKLGPVGSYVAIVAAGPLVSLAIAAAVLYAGLKTENSFWKKRLIMTAALSFVNHVRYAVAAIQLGPTDGPNDFATLWRRAHIHPCAAAALFCLVPAWIIAMSQNRPQKGSPQRAFSPCRT